MAVTTITATRLAVDTASADILDSDGTVASVVGDGWDFVIPATGKVSQLLIRIVADGSGDTVVFTAGDKPPAEQAFLGNKSLVLAASDAIWFQPSSRFLQNDNTVHAYCADTGTKVYAYLMPLGFDGGTSIA